MNDTQHVSAETSGRDARLCQVIDDVLRRRCAGEALADAEVIAAHGSLMPELGERLRFLELIDSAHRMAADLPAAEVGAPNAGENAKPRGAFVADCADDLDDSLSDELDDEIDVEMEDVLDGDLAGEFADELDDDFDDDLDDDLEGPGAHDMRMTTHLPPHKSLQDNQHPWTVTAPLAPESRTAPLDDQDDEARVWRPTARPPMAVLAVLDDNRDSAEFIRIRQATYRIGRAAGDLLIPHDSQIAAAHAELTREESGAAPAWFLTALPDTTGVFVQAAACPLRHGDEFLIGARRLRYERLAEASPERAWERGRIVSADDLAPRLSVELRPNEMWIGSDASACGPLTIDDPCVDRRHAWVQLDSLGRWRLKDANSVNGVWLRVNRVMLRGGCAFRCGEQLFRFFIS